MKNLNRYSIKQLKFEYIPPVMTHKKSIVMGMFFEYFNIEHMSPRNGKTDKPWFCRIFNNDMQICSGNFATEEEAIIFLNKKYIDMMEMFLKKVKHEKN